MKDDSMRTIFYFLCFILASSAARAQDPVHFTFKAVKTGGARYEIHLTAVIDDGWHLYSQEQPKGAIATPASIHFAKSPLFFPVGKVREVGKLEKKTDPRLGVGSWYYFDKVDFVQELKVNTKVKSALAGRITYQVCTEERCLPPETVNFNISFP